MKQRIDIYWGPKKPHWVYSVDPKTQRLSITFPDHSTFLHLLSSDIKTILGFTQETSLAHEGPHVSIFPVDVQRVHTMFVYTDIIQHQIVGDRKAPVLRNVPLFSLMRNDDGSDVNGVETEEQVKDVSSERLYCHQTQIVKTFDVLEYKPINVSTINTSLIELYNEDGRLMPFLDRGRTLLTLLFKQVSES